LSICAQLPVALLPDGIGRIERTGAVGHFGFHQEEITLAAFDAGEPEAAIGDFPVRDLFQVVQPPWCSRSGI
jgi:hypothetical protein